MTGLVRTGALLTVTQDGPAWPPLGLDAYMSMPSDNRPTPAKIALGQRLFFDPILSADGSRSCASCHQRERAFADASGEFADRSVAIARLKPRVPS